MRGRGRAPALPDRVSWPASTGEVSALLADAAAEGVAVVPYGAGSGVCGGASGRAGAWVLDTKDLATIGPLDADARTVRVGAGVIGQQLEDWLQARGYTLGHSPSSISCSTVGGWAAARSAGQFSSRYGVFEDMVVALEAVAPSIGRFTLGAGGDRPDAWMDLVLGSEGTLAVITELTLRVWPAPEARLLRGYRFGGRGHRPAGHAAADAGGAAPERRPPLRSGRYPHRRPHPARRCPCADVRRRPVADVGPGSGRGPSRREGTLPGPTPGPSPAPEPRRGRRRLGVPVGRGVGG